MSDVYAFPRKMRAKTQYPERDVLQPTSIDTAYSEAITQIERGAAMLQYLTGLHPERVTPSQVHRLCSAQLNIHTAYNNIARVHHAK